MTAAKLHQGAYWVAAFELTSRVTVRTACEQSFGKMIDSTNQSQLSPGDLIEQAIAIIMNRFHLGAAQALEVLRRMS